jgi:hypothetical protein
MSFIIRVANTNLTSSPRANINNQNVLQIVNPDGSNLIPGSLIAGQIYQFNYNSSIGKLILNNASIFSPYVFLGKYSPSNVSSLLIPLTGGFNKYEIDVSQFTSSVPAGLAAQCSFNGVTFPTGLYTDVRSSAIANPVQTNVQNSNVANAIVTNINYNAQNSVPAFGKIRIAQGNTQAFPAYMIQSGCFDPTYGQTVMLSSGFVQQHAAVQAILLSVGSGTFSANVTVLGEL